MLFTVSQDFPHYYAHVSSDLVLSRVGDHSFPIGSGSNGLHMFVVIPPHAVPNDLDRATLSFSMTFDADYPKDEQEMNEFKAEVMSEVADRLGIDVSCVSIDRVDRGSITPHLRAELTNNAVIQRIVKMTQSHGCGLLSSDKELATGKKFMTHLTQVSKFTLFLPSNKQKQQQTT